MEQLVFSFEVVADGFTVFLRLEGFFELWRVMGNSARKAIDWGFTMFYMNNQRP